MFDFPIDIVYLWVNSEDENWQKKKEIEAKKLGIDTKNDICRYKDNDELKYSLRSLEKYASWINKIYLVVDNQIPSWLNLENPKIKIINHDEIIPKSCLPTFNSCAIEHCIVNIKGLSEHFLYSNDDTFFADFVEPTFFYAQDGKPFFRYRGYHPEIPTSQYQKMMCSAKNLLNKRYSNISNLMPHHNIDAYCKRDILKCNEEFEDEINETIKHKFRTDEDIERVIYSKYAIAKNLGHKKVLAYKTRWDLKFLGIYKPRDSVILFSQSEKKLRKIKKYKAKLFCINDNEEAKQKDREKSREFLEKYFSEKSSFEK